MRDNDFISERVNDLSLFFTTFTGEYIRMLLNVNMQSKVADEDGVSENITPILAQGYLVDMDEMFLYIGHVPDQISQAINLKNVVHVEFSDPVGEMDDLLETFDPSSMN